MTQNEPPTKEELESRSSSEDMEFDKYITGDYDPYLGRTITRLIYKDKKTLVYIDQGGYVAWACSQQLKEIKEDTGQLLIRAGEIDQIPTSYLSKDQIVTARRYIGEAIARILRGEDSAEINAFMDKTELWIRKRNEECCRMWKLKGSFVTAAIVIIIGTLLLVFRFQVEGWIGLTALEIFFGGCAGCFGALLSVVSRAGTLKLNPKLDPSASKKQHIFDGVMRIIAGGGGAVFVATAIKANLLFGLINSSPAQFQMSMVFCMVAGISERFVPSIVDRVESQSLSA